MYRGDTPTFQFTLPIDGSLITALNISFAQDETVLVEKSLEDVTVAGQTITVALTESETLLFSDEENVQVQLRIGMGKSRRASEIFKVRVKGILKEGALT